MFFSFANIFGCWCWCENFLESSSGNVLHTNVDEFAHEVREVTVTNEISDEEMELYKEEGWLYIPCNSSNIEELIDLVVMNALSNPRLETLNQDSHRFDDLKKKFAKYRLRLRFTLLSQETSISNAQRLSESIIRDSTGILTRTGGYGDGYMVKSQGGKLFYCEYRDGEFLDITNESTINAIKDKSDKSCQTNIFSKAFRSFKILYKLFPFNAQRYATPACLVQEGDLNPAEDLPELYQITEERLLQPVRYKLPDYQLCRWLPYSDVAMLRKTVDGRQVLVRILGYEDEKPVMEYVTPSADQEGFAAVGLEEAKSYFISNPIVI